MICSWRDTRLEETSYAIKCSAFAITLQQVFSLEETTIPSLCLKPACAKKTHIPQKKIPKPKPKALGRSNSTSQENSRRYLEPEHHPLLGPAWAEECGT